LFFGSDVGVITLVKSRSNTLRFARDFFLRDRFAHSQLTVIFSGNGVRRGMLGEERFNTNFLALATGVRFFFLGLNDDLQ